MIMNSLLNVMLMRNEHKFQHLESVVFIELATDTELYLFHLRVVYSSDESEDEDGVLQEVLEVVDQVEQDLLDLLLVWINVGFGVLVQDLEVSLLVFRLIVYEFLEFVEQRGQTEPTGQVLETVLFPVEMG